MRSVILGAWALIQDRTRLFKFSPFEERRPERAATKREAWNIVRRPINNDGAMFLPFIKFCLLWSSCRLDVLTGNLLASRHCSGTVTVGLVYE